jgi:hypothetical protein
MVDGTTENVDVNRSGQPMVLIEGSATASTASETR